MLSKFPRLRAMTSDAVTSALGGASAKELKKAEGFLPMENPAFAISFIRAYGNLGGTDDVQRLFESLPDEATSDGVCAEFVTAFAKCGATPAQIKAVRTRFGDVGTAVNNALIGAFSKSGDFESGQAVFGGMEGRNKMSVMTWREVVHASRRSGALCNGHSSPPF